MGDVRILPAGDQTKLHSRPRFLGRGSSLEGKREGWETDEVKNTQGDEEKEMDRSSQQPLEERTRKGVLAKQLILGLCFLAQHPKTLSSCSCLTPGEEEEEELLLMEHVSKMCSARAQATDLENRSLWLTRILSTLNPTSKERG